MRRSLLSVPAVALGLMAVAAMPAAAGPIGLLPGPGSVAIASATTSVSAPDVERVVFLLNGGSGLSGIWPGGGGASICLGCFVENWNAGSGNPFGVGRAPAATGGGSNGNGNGNGNGNSGSGGFSGQVTLPTLPELAPPLSGNSFTLPFELFGTLNGYNVFGEGQLTFTSSALGGGLATGAPFQSSEAPEPASLVLLATGASALFLAARRRRKARG